jgi:hypothetical protein
VALLAYASDDEKTRVHAAVADDDPDDTTYEHAHGGEVDVCSHAAMALPLLDLAGGARAMHGRVRYTE